MKKMLISMLAMAAMVSCSSESDPIDEVNPTGDNKVEINLNAGVVGVETKAAVDTWTGSEKVQFAHGTANNSFTTLWDASISSSNAVSFQNGGADEKKYYPTDGSSIYLVGFHPGEKTITSNTVSFSIDGQNDIMATSIGTGSRSTIFTDFSFTHLLTQLNFKVIGENGFTGNITKITIKGSKPTAKLDLTLPNSLTFEGEADTNPIIAFTGTETISPTVSTSAFGKIMVQPNTALTLDIETSVGNYNNISIKSSSSNSNFADKTSYNITLTFTKKEVTTNASITGWLTDTGTGKVE